MHFNNTFRNELTNCLKNTPLEMHVIVLFCCQWCLKCVTCADVHSYIFRTILYANVQYFGNNFLCMLIAFKHGS